MARQCFSSAGCNRTLSRMRSAPGMPVEGKLRVTTNNSDGTRTRNPQIRSLIRYPLRHGVEKGRRRGTGREAGAHICYVLMELETSPEVRLRLREMRSAGVGFVANQSFCKRWNLFSAG